MMAQHGGSHREFVPGFSDWGHPTPPDRHYLPLVLLVALVLLLLGACVGASFSATLRGSQAADEQGVCSAAVHARN